MSAHNVGNQIYGMTVIKDPGNAGTIYVDRKTPVSCALTSAGAETRTLARPTRQGPKILISMKVDAGDITLTVTGGFNEDGDTTFTFSDPGQYAIFEAIADSTTTYVWRKTADYSTANITPTEAAFLDGVTAGTDVASKASIAGSDGGHAFIGRLTTTDGVASGTAKVIGGLAYSNTAASTAIASTSAETAFDTLYSIPANTLKAGTVVKVRVWGTGTTVVGTDTLAWFLRIGGLSGTALITSAATTMVNAHTFQGEATLICRTAGTTGTCVATSTYKVNSAEGTMTVKDDVLASTTINTQAAQVINATAQFNTTNANSVRLDLITVEIY